MHVMAHVTDRIFIFKSNIKTDKDVHFIQKFLDIHPRISRWTVDTSDRDCVLRIVSGTLAEHNIIDIISRCGYNCELLTD
jgi:hypothetical protein